MRANDNINIQYGAWLNTLDWDTFSTITYRKNIRPKANRGIMTSLGKYLDKRLDDYMMFWAMEYTHRGLVHDHLLVKNAYATKHIDSFLKSKGLSISKGIKHIPYDKDLGASYYVSKYLNRKDAQYDIIIK